MKRQFGHPSLFGMCARLLCVLLFLAGWQVNSTAQAIYLNSQAEVNAFDPNVSSVTYLTIDGADITDLSPLSNLTSVGAYLVISNNALLTNLDGLAGLTSIGSNLDIYNNALLANIDGLANLSSVGGRLDITDNASLANLDGLAGRELGNFFKCCADKLRWPGQPDFGGRHDNSY